MERREQIEELFHDALARPPSQRGAFLSEACASDPKMRSAVESLISAHEESGGFLDSPPFAAMERALADAEAELLVGSCLGEYEVLEFISRGGMGCVYLARDNSLERRVALKLLPAEYTEDQARLRRFILEAKAASSLNHPNIITIHEIGHIGTVHFIATEFVEGETLRRKISRGPLPVNEAVDLAKQVASALSAAHAAGIVHRDIKPENIMLRPDGYVKVLDFGLAKLAEAPRIPASSSAPTAFGPETDPGTVMGTTKYMSPEQARGLDVDRRSDIFSLGVVIYEMIAGKVPFSGETRADVIASILRTEPTPIAKCAPGIPAALASLVGVALKKDEAERYQTAEELIKDLKVVERELEVWTTLVLRMVARLGQMFRRSLGAQFAAVSLVATLAAAGIWVGRNGFNRQGKGAQATHESWRSVMLTSWRDTPGGSESSPRFSPDGKFIAYSSVQGANPETIWIKPVPSGDSFPILGNVERKINPIWSPDGNSIAFISPQANHASVYEVPYLGGDATLLKEIGEEGKPLPVLKRWSKDGSTIYYEMNGNLFALSTASQATVPVTSFDPSSQYSRDFSISANEDRIAYRDKKDGKYSILVRPMSGGTAVRVTDDSADDSAPCWLPDGQRIIYSSDRAGVYQLCTAYLNGSKPEQITFGDSSYTPTDVSWDGSRVLYTTVSDISNIWRVRTDGGGESEVTSGFGVEFWPVVSPDGKLLAFQDTGKPHVQRVLSHSTIIIKPLGTGQETREVPSVEDGFDPIWLPDGSGLSFLRKRDSIVNIWTVSTKDTESKQLTTAGVYPTGYTLMPYSRIENGGPSWSTDSRQAAYCSSRSGQSNVWIAAADGSAERNLTNNANAAIQFASPSWSPDNSRIAFLRESTRTAELQTKWSVCIVEGENVRVLFSSERYLRLLGWSESGDHVLVVSADGESFPTPTVRNVELIQVSISAPDHETVARFESTYPFSTRLSPNRDKAIFISRKDGKDNIWVLPTAGGEAKKMTGNSDPGLYFSSPSWSPDGTIYYGRQWRLNVVSMIEDFR